MSYKVLIPAAGTGSRLEEITKYINKSLVPIGSKAAISRIIEMFPDDVEFVIATGYKGEVVKEFLQLAYPDRRIDIVDVIPYEGVGSGLGLSIQKCKKYLQEPFVFCSCDTLVEEKIPEPNTNWMGYGYREHLLQYRTLHLSKMNTIDSINEKGEDKTSQARPYIGLAGIKDYEAFWEFMDIGAIEAIETGEVYGLRKILEQGKKVRSVEFTWFDTGVKNELRRTRTRFGIDESTNLVRKYNLLGSQMNWTINDRKILFFNNPYDTMKAFLKLRHEGLVAQTKHMVCIRK